MYLQVSVYMCTQGSVLLVPHASHDLYIGWDHSTMSCLPSLLLTYVYQCTWGWLYLIHVNGCRAGCWTWWTYLVRAEGFESCMRGLCIEKTWLSPSLQHSSSEGLHTCILFVSCLCTKQALVSVPDWPLSLYQTDPCLCTRQTRVSVPDWPLSLYQTDPCLCTRLTRVSVPDWPLSLYQTDPCLCTRLTLVSVPEMLLCWFSVLVAGIVTYLDANRTVQVRRRYACPYTTRLHMW